MRLVLLLAIATMFTFSTGEDQSEEVDLLAQARPPKYTEMMEELKDMLVVSMQDMVSNNDLITQLTQKVVQNMLSVGESKKEMEILKKSHSDEVAKLKDEIEGLRKELRSQVETVDTDLKNQMEKMETGLNTTVGEVRRDISQISQQVTIVSAEDGLRDRRCAKVCAGTTGRRSSNWINYSSTGMNIIVDISGCGFVTTPTVTTSLEGASSHWKTTGSSEIYSVTTKSFTTYIDAKSASSRANASGWLWNMEWVAVGYTC